MTAACQHFTFPRPGFTSPDSAVVAALVFASGGVTADYVRYFADPEDGMFAEVIAEMDKITAEGWTAQDCKDILAAARETVTAETALVPSPRTSLEAG